MKLTGFSKLFTLAALGALGTVAAYATPVDCATLTNLQAAITAGSCTTVPDGGDVVFSNFAVTNNGNTNITFGQEVQSNYASVAFSVTTDGSGDYSVVTDFSCAILTSGCTPSSPQFAVADTPSGGQTEALGLSYLITATNANTTITEADGLAYEGINNDAGSNANGTFTKMLCTGAAYTGFSGTGESTAASGCSTGQTTILNATWDQADQGAPGDPTNPSANQSQQFGMVDVSPDASMPANQTSFGVADVAFVYSGDGNTGNADGYYNAAVGAFENDFTETFSGAPEPGTFVLLGGALIALGAIRRKKLA
jgi:hypothetical protein